MHTAFLVALLAVAAAYVLGLLAHAGARLAQLWRQAPDLTR
jgi:hypothetical protein